MKTYKNNFSFYMALTLGVFFILFILLSITGCGTTTYKKLPSEKVVVTETKEVYRVEKCDVPNLSSICDFSGEHFTPTEKLLNCVIAQKRALDICSGNIKE